MAMKRQTAYRFWIRDIVSAEKEVNKEGFVYFSIKGKEAVRVNIIANIINSYSNESGSYLSITMDDGSGQIRVKAWNEDTGQLSGIAIGDMVLVVGRISESSGEIFVRPEIVKKVNEAEWELARKLELIESYGKPDRMQQQLKEEAPVEVKEEVVEEVVVAKTDAKDARGKIVKILEEAPAGGIEIQDTINKSGLGEDEADGVIEELLKEGEVFQPKRGFLKLID